MRTHGLIILMVEDDEGDIFFMKHALEKAAAGHTAHFVANGEEAIAYLTGQGKYADRSKFPLPNIILTDLNMPKRDGLEFLHWLRSHPQNAVIPTIMFSSSGQASDVQKAYELGANSYMTKPSNINELVDLIRVTYEYWCRCERPPMARRSFEAEAKIR